MASRPARTESKFKKLAKNVKNFILNKRYDPVQCLPNKVMDKIFDYFTGPELMTMSLVNKRWYRHIGYSKQHMDKVQILISEEKSGDWRLFGMNDATIMTQHGRKYAHICLLKLKFGLQTQHKLLLASFQWTSVILVNHIFKNQIDLNDFLGLVEPFVEELRLQCVILQKPLTNTLDQNFTFPKLKKLMIRNSSSYVYNGPFNSVTKLKSLIIGTETASNYSTGRFNANLRINGIQNILLSNSRYLQYLELFLSQEDFDIIFINERFLRNIQFQVYKLSVGCFVQEDNAGNNIVQIKNFINFLETQKHSLFELCLEKWLGIAVLNCTVNELHIRGLTITTFEQFGRHNETFDELALRENRSIEHLEIWTEHQKILNRIVRVCQRLKFLQLRLINQETLQILAEYCPNLEVIICDSFTAFQPLSDNVLDNLRHMKINVTCCNNFIDMTNYKQSKNNFDRVFLEAVQKFKDQTNEEIRQNPYKRTSF